MIKSAKQDWTSNRPTACGARAKPACMRQQGGLLRGPGGLQPSGLPAQPWRADGPRRRCHALGAVITQHACLGRRGGTSTEGSAAGTAEEGLHGGHQRSEGRTPGVAR
jgi:hypothetical protein